MATMHLYKYNIYIYIYIVQLKWVISKVKYYFGLEKRELYTFREGYHSVLPRYTVTNPGSRRITQDNIGWTTCLRILVTYIPEMHIFCNFQFLIHNIL